MNSGCGINPTTLLFPSTTTIVDRMCVSFSSSRSILYPSSSVSSVTTSVPCLACVCTLHVFGSCPAATHSITMSRSEIAPVFGIVHHRHDRDVLGTHQQGHLRARGAGGGDERLGDHDFSSEHGA